MSTRSGSRFGPAGRSAPNLAQRLGELDALALPGARLELRGTELRYTFQVSPGEFGRLYRCMLKMRQDSRHPELIVLEPDLKLLAAGRTIPHIYPHKGRGTKLCLWWPKAGDWAPQMKLAESFIPWTAEWLYFFEDWLACGEWRGGGEHPDLRPKRWSHPSASSITSRRATPGEPSTISTGL